MLRLLPFSICWVVQFFIPLFLVSSSVLAKSSSSDLQSLRSRVANAATLNSNGIEVSTSDDLTYTIDITLGGQPYTVLLDTGSSDLWIDPLYGTPEPANSTNVTATITYAKGEVNGTIHLAELKIGNFTVESQAFLSADSIEDINLDRFHGILGLGFDNGGIHRALTEKGFIAANTTVARSPLTSIFAQNKSLPNLFDIQLGRTDELADITQGTFVIGGHAENYEDIEKTALFMFHSENTSHWTVWLDNMKINGQTFFSLGTPNFTDTLGGSYATMLDTGTSFSLLPPEIVDAIYSPIPGALFDHRKQVWIVPCTASANVTFNFLGLPFPVHPLDLTKTVSTVVDESSKQNVTYCINTFQYLEINSNVYEYVDADVLLGATFLRNVYVSFNYGDYITNELKATTGVTPIVGPGVQMQSTTNVSTMWEEFHQVRSAALAKLPPEISPEDVVRYDDGGSSKRLASKYIALIAVLGGCALLGAVLLAVYLRRRRQRVNARKYGPQYVAVNLQDIPNH